MATKRYLVIGLGRFGMSLAESLTDRGYEVLAADRDMQALDVLKDRVAYAVELDGTDPEALRSIECTSCTAAIVAMGANFECSVLTVAALKEVGVGYVIARARTPRHRRILQAIGASEVLEVESEMGRTLAERIIGKPGFDPS